VTRKQLVNVPNALFFCVDSLTLTTEPHVGKDFMKGTSLLKLLEQNNKLYQKKIQRHLLMKLLPPLKGSDQKNHLDNGQLVHLRQQQQKRDIPNVDINR
jgi:hypothetical protein